MLEPSKGAQCYLTVLKTIKKNLYKNLLIYMVAVKAVYCKMDWKFKFHLKKKADSSRKQVEK